MGMTPGFVGGQTWGEIAAAVSSARLRHAAVAFLGVDAPTILPMKRGDTLVVNASDSAVRSRATCPAAIETYLQAGVLVYNEQDLHAKVVVTSKCAVVGSANASARSRDRVIEAVLITDDHMVIAEVKKFVVSLAEEPKLLTAADLPRLQKLWDEGESNDLGRAVPGVNRDTEDLITDFSAGFALDEMDDEEVDPATARKIARRVRRGHREAGIGVGWLTLQEGDAGYPVGTVLFVFDDEGVDPPRVIASEPTRSPDGCALRYQVYRYDLAQEGDWRSWDDLDGPLCGLRSRVSEDGYLEGAFDDRSRIGPALLAEWGIEMPGLPRRTTQRNAAVDVMLTAP